MQKILLLYIVLLLAGCATKKSTASSGVSSLNSKNLTKNPTTGVYSLKSINTNNPFRFFTKEISNGIALPARTNLVESKNIPAPSIELSLGSKTELEKGGTIKKKEDIYITNLKDSQKPIEPKKTIVIDWVKIVIYYLLVFHIIAIAYVAWKGKLFNKIKNPFVKPPSKGPGVKSKTKTKKQKL